MSSRKEIADCLKEAAGWMFFKYRYSIAFELGLTSWGARRADVIGSKISGDLVIVEVKSSVADFRSDSKWHEYLAFADRVYLAMTKEVAEKILKHPELSARIPDRVGILILGADGYMKTRKPAKRESVLPAVRLSILARLAWRAGDLSKRTTRQRRRVYLPE